MSKLRFMKGVIALSPRVVSVEGTTFFCVPINTEGFDRMIFSKGRRHIR
jgi:hypothetical protein